MPGIEVFPLHGLGLLFVLTDVSHELSLQIRYGSEHTTGDHVAPDLGNPQFDLVEPGRVSRGEMQMNVGVLYEERIDLLSLVRREVVRDHVDLLALGLVRHYVGEEGHELGRVVARSCLTKPFPHPRPLSRGRGETAFVAAQEPQARRDLR